MYNVDYFVELVKNSTLHDPNGNKFIFTSKKSILKYNEGSDIKKTTDSNSENRNIMDAFLNGTPCVAIKLYSNGGCVKSFLNDEVDISDEVKTKFLDTIRSIKGSRDAARSIWLVYEIPNGTDFDIFEENDQKYQNVDFDFNDAVNQICDVFKSCAEGICTDSFAKDLFRDLYPNGAYINGDSAKKKRLYQESSAKNLVRNIDKLIKKCYTLGKELADYGDIDQSAKVCHSLKDTIAMIKKETELSYLKKLEDFKLE